MKKEFTASVYIIEKKKVLLIKHPKLNKWLPPGGHIEENEMPHEAARREALEETGMHIEFIPQENVWIEQWNAKSFERPYLCLLEEIPPFKDQGAHQHIDFVYLAKPMGTSIPLENISSKWFDLKQIRELTPDEDIFIETLEVLTHLLV
ncbi:MAG: NUDIX domain-containing protein [Parachlamydia sp.]|nr:NUDIX domain-containing protein [Parachlamydia sp.]